MIAAFAYRGFAFVWLGTLMGGIWGLLLSHFTYVLLVDFDGGRVAGVAIAFVLAGLMFLVFRKIH